MPLHDLEPSVGRIVHYVPPMTLKDDIPVCRPGIVVEVFGTDDVDITVMEPFGITHRFSVQHDETLQRTDGLHDHVPDTWHWPEMINKGFSMQIKGVESGSSAAGAE